MQGPGTHMVNATPVPVSEGVMYELTAPATGSGAVHWAVEVAAGGETWTERDGYGPGGEQPATDTIAGAGTSVRVWRAPADGVARFSVVIDGAATVTAATVAGRTGRVVLTVPGDILAENIMASGGLLAGDPDGARVVINADGVVAFDSSGTETAQITGEGGEFVGGEFRTSDGLPGKVEFSDNAYLPSWGGAARPGLRITPGDGAAFSAPPGIGPGDGGIYVDGGRDQDGNRSFIRSRTTDTSLWANGASGISSVIQSTPASSIMRTYRADGIVGGEMVVRSDWTMIRSRREDAGTGGEIRTSPVSSRVRTYSGNSSEAGWIKADPKSAELAYVDPNNTYFSRILTDEDSASLYTRAGGVERRLTIDKDGIWVQTGRDGAMKSYNLEEAAQDSGWQAFGLEAGVTGSSAVAWRNKGGVIYFRGFVTGDWTNGVWNTIASGLNPDWLPSATWVVAEAGGATKGATLQMTADGRLRISPPVTSTTSYYLNAMTYPAG